MAKRKFKDPVTQKAVLVYLLTILIGYLVLHYGVLNQYSRADEIELATATKRSELQDLLAKGQRAEQLRGEIAEYERVIESLRGRLPPPLAEDELVRALGRAASAAGIEGNLESFQRKGTTTENEVTISEREVSFISGYHEFARFVVNLSRFLPQVEIRELTMTGLAGATPGRTLEGTLLLAVYSSSLARPEPGDFPAAADEADELEDEALSYRDLGRRDPFLPPGPQPGEMPTASQANLANLHYRGMLSVDGKPTALVEDAAGVGYSLKVGDSIAGGQVVSISSEELVISAPGWGRRVLRVETGPPPGTVE